MIRKVLLCLLAVLLITLLGYTVYAGILSIPGYQRLDSQSRKLDSDIQNYEDKNDVQLKSKQKAIQSQIDNYKKQKEEYEQLLEEKQSQDQEVDSANCYDVDFLWARVGNYATNHDLTLNFDITKSLSDTGKSEYVLTDLNFSVSGEYDQIAKFINDIETDNRLEFEIRSLDMRMAEEKNGAGSSGSSDSNASSSSSSSSDSNNSSSNGNVLRADFIIYGIAINKATLTDLNNASATPTTPQVGDTSASVSNTSASVSNTSVGF